MVAAGHPLRQLAEVVFRQHLPQLRLADEDDLQQLLLRRLEIRQEPELFEYLVGQVLRFVDEQGETIAPAEFMPAARRSNMMQALDRWVIGASIALCREHGISSATFYSWRKKYGGMEAGDAKRLRVLEAENAKLKRIVADQMLDMSAMKDLLQKHW